MINILHITDFHYKPERKFHLDQQNIIDKISENIKEDIDLIIFSGDLVFQGNSQEDFFSAKDILLEPLRKKFGLDNSKVILCAGNHDIDRSKAITAIFKFVDEKIIDNPALDNYVNSKDYQHSIRPLDNYLKFEKEFYKETNELLKSDPLFKVLKIKIGNKNLGVVTINNSWRAIGEEDQGELIFPISKFKEAVSYLTNDLDYKIFVMHHPFSDFNMYNSYELSNLVFQNFDILFSGHLHKKENEINYTSRDGIIKLSTVAALTDQGDLGYTILKIDSEDQEYNIHNHFYDKKNSIFYSDLKENIEIPTSSEKKEQNKFRKKLKEKYESELLLSSKLLVSGDQDVGENSFFNITTQPVLKNHSASEITNQEIISPDFDWDNFKSKEDDYLILGKGKCGKTILLKKIQLELLRDFSSLAIIPYYIDLKDWKGNKDFSLLDELRAHYQINKSDAKILAEQKPLVLLIDNYHINTNVTERLIPFIESNSEIRIIACSEETILKNIQESKIDGRTLNKLYFHRLRKKHIRQLTKNIFRTGSIDKEEVVEKLSAIFNRLSIPFNFWSVSLFLWVFKKDLNNNLQNDVELVNLYIEKLLEKEQLTITQSNFGFDKYKRFLSSLAYQLLTNHSEYSYSMSYAQLIAYTDEYLKENLRYTIESREVIEYIEDRGIILKKADERYTFRLKGVFEYFLANQLMYDHKFLEEIIAQDSLYLAFANEFELYAGFRRDDEEFLDNIYNRTKEIFKNLENEYGNDDSISLDDTLIEKLSEITDLKPVVDNISDSLKDGLSLETQDEIEEESLNSLGVDDSYSEVQIKDNYIIDESIVSLEKSMYILGRVFKNIDEIRSNKKVNDIFDYILNTSCFWGFKIIDEIKQNDFDDLVDKKDQNVASKLLKLITNFIPTLVQTRMSDMVGDKNLEKVINLKIEELKCNSKKNQYKLFILYFLLIDIDFNKYKNKIDEIISLVSIPVIRYSIILKLNFYLGFKISKDDKDSVLLLRNSIQRQQMIFNNKSDISSLHQNLDEKKNKKKSID
jgi:predicted phosphodiesterase